MAHLYRKTRLAFADFVREFGTAVDTKGRVIPVSLYPTQHNFVRRVYAVGPNRRRLIHRGPYGVAIRPTTGVLDHELPYKVGELPICLGQVRYIDYSSASEIVEIEATRGRSVIMAKHGNPITFHVQSPFVCKSVAYKHEAELRALFMDMMGRGFTDRPAGVWIPVDRRRLVQGVKIWPLAPGSALSNRSVVASDCFLRSIVHFSTDLPFLMRHYTG